MTNSASLRGGSFQHPLGRDSSIPRGFEESRLLYLTQRIRNFTITPDERQELGRGFIRLALSIAASYASRRPQKADDYASAALFGIAYALKHAGERLKDDNITPYVASCIRSHLKKFHANDHMVRTPPRTLARAKEGEILTITVLQVDEQELNREASRCPRRTRAPKTGVQDLWETLKMSAICDTDRKIIDLRSQGYNDGEVAEQMGVSASYIQRKRKELEERFEQRRREED